MPADVRFTGTDLKPDPLEAGETAFAIAHVSNFGDAAGSRRVTVNIGDRQIYQQTVDVEAFGGRDIVIPFTVPSVDSFELRTDDMNNTRRQVNVELPSERDEMYISGGPFGVPSTVNKGEPFTATFEVTCPGPSGCDATQVGVNAGNLINDPTIKTSQIQGMSAGSTKQINVQIVPDSTGTTIFWVWLKDEEHSNRAFEVDVQEAPNQDPTVTITGIEKRSNSIVPQVDASDPDGNIQQYNWSLMQNGSEVASSQNEMPEFTGIGAGAFTLSVTVTDNEGATSDDTVTFTFQPEDDGQPPENGNGDQQPPDDGQQGQFPTQNQLLIGAGALGLGAAALVATSGDNNERMR